ncbi:cinnamoyl-CoA reductase 1-like [Elaeis guineensis]|uniref:Cinnamoyl-CoA reductase 1 n=1 Tax=Elaeis guineensis var. tenera TaxID=51953 RepID=A0A6I9QQW8_ELAGV|nr:cinnamoyl-CoA reductase 1 [Elaeis guineensis]
MINSSLVGEREQERGMEKLGEKRRVCVTGAGGFIASWLVKVLLKKGFILHGTVRDPSDEKNAHLKKLENASENLQLFKADLLDYHAITSAIAGCEGVFHVASPVPAAKVPNPEVEVITPAVTGTLNVLKACREAKVKRVVVVSSGAAITMIPNWPEDKMKDESCWSDKEYCRITESWYSLSKTLAESEALEYAEKHGLDVVTVCPFVVIGPLLQPTVNSSSLFLINILTGVRESVENKRWSFVDVRDVVDALLLVYEKPEASGRYICASHTVKLRDLVDMLKSMYPNYNYSKTFVEGVEGSLVSSEKLKMLGWECRRLEESLIDSVECYRDAGLLSKD